MGIVYGETINIGDLEVNKHNTEIVKTFKIYKVENHKYILKFQHYGLKTHNITICLYLNNNPIYTINEENACHIHNKPYPNVSLDVTNRIQNGTNNISLKLINGDLGNGWGYKIHNVIIESPTAKAPIPTPAIIIGVLAMTFIILKRENNS